MGFLAADTVTGLWCWFTEWVFQVELTAWFYTVYVQSYGRKMQLPFGWGFGAETSADWAVYKVAVQISLC